MQFDQLRRREFITLLGGVVACPFAAAAQQPALPVIGFLESRSPDALTDRLRGFRLGLSEVGYVEGENVMIVYSWAEQSDRLPMLAAELVRRPVTVIATGGGPAPAFAAKAATTTIPIVFLSADDPVRRGLVASLARPGGNLTGINFFNAELAPKQLGLLQQLLPAATRVAALINPVNPVLTEYVLADLEPAARTLGLQIEVVRASTVGEIDAVFSTFARERPDALFVGSDPFLNARRVQLALAAMRHAIPAIYASGREAAEAGGLISYGSDITDAYRQMGIYVGRILKGAKPADLPIVQASKFELVINQQTARMLGLKVPPSLLATADEVIE
jgi:putative ABC transport system substrate-binding protein